MTWRRIPLVLVVCLLSMGASDCWTKFPLDHRYSITLWPGCLDLAHGFVGDVDAIYKYGRVHAKVWGESYSRRAWLCPSAVDPMLVYQKSVLTFKGHNLNLVKANGASEIKLLSDGSWRVTYELLGVDSAVQPYWGVPEIYANDLVVTHSIESRFAFAGQTGTDIQKKTKTVSLVDWEWQQFLQPYQERWEEFSALCYDLVLPIPQCLELMSVCQETLGLDWDGCIHVGQSIAACDNGYTIIWRFGKPWYVCSP